MDQTMVTISMGSFFAATTGLINGQMHALARDLTPRLAFASRPAFPPSYSPEMSGLPPFPHQSPPAALCVAFEALPPDSIAAREKTSS